MKKLSLILAAALLLLTLAACGNKNDTPAGSTANSGTQPAGTTAPAGTESPAPGTTGSGQEGSAETAMIPGTLKQIVLKEGDAPVVKGLRLAGNRAGTGDTASGFNSKPSGTESIRCIFELNEYVEVYPDTEKTDGLQVWAFAHREDQTSYETLTFSDAAEGFAAVLDLARPEAQDDSWGSFYLNPSDLEDGYYDLVFTADGKPAATLLTRFYKEGELENKSDAELEQIQKGLEALTVK